MVDREKDDSAGGAAWTYNRPKAGLSRGSKEGFVITAIVAIVLFVIVFVVGVPPSSPRSIFADFVLAVGLSALGVWGVGGMIEVSGKIRDLTLKAGGGIAIIALVMFVFRPFHSADVDTSFDEVFEVGPHGSVGVLLATYNNQYFNNEKHAIHVVIPEDTRDRVMNFKAEPFGQKARYRASWDILRQRNPRLEILSAISERQSCLSFREESDTSVVAVLDGELINHEVPGEGGTIYTCGS